MSPDEPPPPQPRQPIGSDPSAGPPSEPADPPSPPKLLDPLRERLRVQHYALRTERACVDWARRYILFHGKRHPRDMAAPEMEAF